MKHWIGLEGNKEVETEITTHKIKKTKGLMLQDPFILMKKEKVWNCKNQNALSSTIDVEYLTIQWVSEKIYKFVIFSVGA